MKLFCPKKISFILFNLLTAALISQSFELYHQFGNQGNDKIFELKALPDGTFIAAGTFTETIEIGDNQFISLGDEDLWIARFDENLEVVWAMSGGSARQNEVTDLQIGADGAIYWTGTFSRKGTFGNFTLTPRLTNKSVFIIKMNFDGEILDATSLSGKNAKTVNELAIDEDSNIFLVGNFSDTLFHADTFFVSNYFDNFFTAKMNSNFEIEWFRQVAGDGFSNGNAITLLSDGAVISAGDFRGNMFLKTDSIKTGTADEDVFFAKFSMDGEPLFLRRAGGVFASFCKKAVSDSEGNFYLGGHHEGVLKLDENIQIQTDGRDDNFFVLAYRSDGSAIWGESYGSMENSELTDLQVLENQLFISGFYDGDMEIQSQNLPVGDGFFNAFFGGFSKLNGSLNWITSASGNDAIPGKCITPLSAKSVIFGYDFSNQTNFGDDQFSSNGFFDFVIAKSATPEPVSIEKINQLNFSIYPNPTSDFIFVETDLWDFKIEIFSNLGAQVGSFFNQKKLNISNLPTGIFYFKITNSRGEFLMKKIIKN